MGDAAEFLALELGQALQDPLVDRIAAVEQGDSGSVLVARGRAAGVVFARSTATGNTAWAIDISEVDALLAAAGDDAVDLGACV